MSDPDGSLAAAGAASRARASSWVMLERSPKLVDPGDLLSGTDYAVDFVAPPSLSSLLLSRALIPAAADGDDYLCSRVECVDGQGNLLLSLHSGPEQGGRGQLVYLSGSGTRRVLPEVPEELSTMLRFGRDACTGITACPGPAFGFAVAQVHRRASSSSAAPNRVLYFSSSTSTWAAIDVGRRRRFKAHSDDEGYLAVEEEEAMDYCFEAHITVSHDTASRIAFVDLNHRLILLFTPAAATATFVHFPSGDDCLPATDVEEVVTRRVMGSSEDSLFVVEVSDDRKWITMARLSDKDNWEPTFKVTAGEVFGSATRIAEAAAAGLQLGPINPTDSKKIILYVPGIGLSFTAEFNGVDEVSPRFVHDDAPSRSWLDVVVWSFLNNPDAGCVQKLATKTAHMGARAVKVFRENVHYLPPLACVLGGFIAQFSGFSALVAAGVVGVATGLNALNKAVGAGEMLSTKVRKWRSSGQLLVMTIGNKMEA